MLNPIFKLLPMFAVAWLARRYCEQFRLTVHGLYAMPFEGVLIKVEATK